MEQIEDFVYDFKQQVQKFARANDDDANIALLKRLAQVIGYYDSSLVNPDNNLNLGCSLANSFIASKTPGNILLNDLPEVVTCHS